jgi:hypothetical protein
VSLDPSRELHRLEFSPDEAVPRGNLLFRDPAAIDSSSDAEDLANMTEDEKELTLRWPCSSWLGERSARAAPNLKGAETLFGHAAASCHT